MNNIPQRAVAVAAGSTPMRPIVEAIQTNNRLREELKERIKMLADRLNDVSEPPTPAPKGNAPEVVRSHGVLGQIQDSNRDLQDACEAMNDLTNRLLF